MRSRPRYQDDSFGSVLNQFNLKEYPPRTDYFFVQDPFIPIAQEIVPARIYRRTCKMDVVAQRIESIRNIKCEATLETLGRWRLPSSDFLNAIKEYTTDLCAQKNAELMQTSLHATALMAMGIILQEYIRELMKKKVDL